MSRKNIIFDEKKVKKGDFYKNEKVIKIDDIDVDKILVSKKNHMALKYLIGYNDDDVIRPLCIKIAQMVEYIKCFDSNKVTYFKAIDNKLLKKYTKIWKKVINLVDVKCLSESVYGDNGKYMKSKIKNMEIE